MKDWLICFQNDTKVGIPYWTNLLRPKIFLPSISLSLYLIGLKSNLNAF